MRINKIILIGIYLIFSLTTWGQNPCKMEIDKKNDTIYKRGEPIPYSGNYEEYYPGDLKMKGTYLNGLKNGEFTFYAWDRLTDSIVNYKNGKRNGIKKTFDALGYPEYFENYINDTIDGDCYYWATGGQLLDIVTFKMGKKIKIDTCNYTDTIHLIKCSIVGEKNGIIPKSYYFSNDSIKVNLINVNDQEPYDTLPLTNKYNIISFKYNVLEPDIWSGYYDCKNGFIHTYKLLNLDALEIIDLLI